MTDNPSSQRNRRDFMQAGAAFSATALASLAASDALYGGEPQGHAAKGKQLIKPGQTILFQGDSITDAGRSRDSAAEANSQAALGNGYAWLAAAQLLVDSPDANLKFFNRGVSGNKVHQLAQRWKADCLDIKPDVLSILIGVNDIWHQLAGQYEGSLETYERDYRALVKRTQDALPKVKLVLCEPFVLKTGHVDETWFPAFDGYRAAAKKIADESGALFVPFQKMFDTAIQFAPPDHWAADGVHPTSHGAALMAHWWMKAVAV
jgi:lysophospholipase L1-like esterase